MLDEILSIAGLLLAVALLVFVLVKAFGTDGSIFSTVRRICSGILLAALILFACSLLIVVLCSWARNRFESNPAVQNLMEGFAWLSIYGLMASATVFIGVLLPMVVVQLVGWARSQIKI